MYVCNVCHVRDLVGQKKGVDPLELTIWMALSGYAGAGN